MTAALLALLLFASPGWDPEFKRDVIDRADTYLVAVGGYDEPKARELAQCWADWVEPQVSQEKMMACVGVGQGTSKCPWSTAEFVAKWVIPAKEACAHVLKKHEPEE